MSSEFSFDISDFSLEYDTLTGASVDVGESNNVQVAPDGSTTVSIGQVVDAEVDPANGVTIDFGGQMNDVSVDLADGVSVGVGDIVGVQSGSNGIPEVTVFGMEVIDTISDAINIDSLL
ncbi:MAG: hypothetical protein ACRDBG_27745 [Waterburya sp.]